MRGRIYTIPATTIIARNLQCGMQGTSYLPPTTNIILHNKPLTKIKNCYTRRSKHELVKDYLLRDSCQTVPDNKPIQLKVPEMV